MAKKELKMIGKLHESLCEISDKIDKLSNDVHNNAPIKFEKITFKCFLEEYYYRLFEKRVNGDAKLKKLKATILLRMVEYFGGKYLHEITVQDIHNWVISLDNTSKTKLQPITIDRYCSIMRAILNKAIKFKFLDKNIVLEYEFKARDNINQRILTDDEISALFSEAEISRNTSLPLILSIALNTGLRKNELRKLKKSDIIIHQNCTYIKVRAENAKSNKERAVPVNANLYQMLAQHVKNLNDDDFMFNSSFIKAFNNCVSRVKLKYRIEHFRFHDLRHTFASKLIERGATISDVKALLGHSTVRLTERYMHHNIKGLINAVNLLNKIN